MIVIGLGPGRSGTASLAHFLNRQHRALVFHELNPRSMHYKWTYAPVRNTMNEFQMVLNGSDVTEITMDLTLPSNWNVYIDSVRNPEKYKGMIDLIGDVALYYLEYVEYILSLSDDVQFVCIKRDVDKIVDSFLRRTDVNRSVPRMLIDRLECFVTGRPYYRARNHWMQHDGSEWMPDPIWDKNFPKFDAKDRADAIRQYVESYYRKAESLNRRLAQNFLMIDVDDFNTERGQASLLTRLGLPPSDHVYTFSHENRGNRAGARAWRSHRRRSAGPEA